jgi:hypothetical protein
MKKFSNFHEDNRKHLCKRLIYSRNRLRYFFCFIFFHLMFFYQLIRCSIYHYLH